MISFLKRATQLNQLPEEFRNSIVDGRCLKLVLSSPVKNSGVDSTRVDVRPIELRSELRYQFAFRRGKQETHENLSPDEAADRAATLFGRVFLQCHLFTAEADWSARTSSGGRVKVRRDPPTRKRENVEHDRARSYLIPDDRPCPFLVEIGVMTEAGRVRASKRRKFRQINRFLELVDDVVDSLPADGVLSVVDFGCGKSYLTFALYHLLTSIRGRKVEIIGIDRNESVVRDCRRAAANLECEGLEFQTGDIRDHETTSPVHLAVSLHACDTATDDALAKAVGWNADVILAVPCCQHELSGMIANAEAAPLFEHGILRERFAALATDALRARVLELCGYATQVVEFIDMEHTAKNLLIRAVKRSAPAGNREEQRCAYEQFRALLGLKEQTHLERMLDVLR